MPSDTDGAPWIGQIVLRLEISEQGLLRAPMVLITHATPQQRANTLIRASNPIPENVLGYAVNISLEGQATDQVRLGVNCGRGWWGFEEYPSFLAFHLEIGFSPEEMKERVER